MVVMHQEHSSIEEGLALFAESVKAYQILMNHGYEYPQIVRIIPIMMAILMDFLIKIGGNEEETLQNTHAAIDLAYSLMKVFRKYGIID